MNASSTSRSDRGRTATSFPSESFIISSDRSPILKPLGGGLLPGGGLPEWVVRRLEGCRHLYLQQQHLEAQKLLQQPGAQQQQLRRWVGAGPPIVLLGAGTPHKPAVLDPAGYVLHESTAYAAYLMSHGVPAGDLLKEAQSYDTVGNAYFSLVIHSLPAGWRCAQGGEPGCAGMGAGGWGLPRPPTDAADAAVGSTYSAGLTC